MKTRARDLRKNMTEAESRLWDFLRNRQLSGYKLVRQQIIGSYIADFVCRQKKVIIEVDGSHHANTIAYDEERTVFLEEEGYKVFRVWNKEVFRDIEKVLEGILGVLKG